MTELPDDMEAVVARMEANLRGHDAVFAMRTGKAFEMLDVYAADLRALLLAYQERGRALEALMDAEFARDWRTWSDERARLLLGVGLRYDAFMAARATLNQKGKSHD
jgi:hypothetical protein